MRCLNIIKENEEKIKYLTQVEMKKVFKVIEKDNSIHALRNLSIFRVAYRCALRASEVGLIITRQEEKCIVTGLRGVIITP